VSAVGVGALREALDRLPGLRVLVVGDSCVDGWLSGTSRALSREGPVPVVSVRTSREAPGGAANAAAGAAALGARVRLLSVVGDDPDGVRLGQLLAEAGVVPADLVVDPGRGTVAKRRVSSGGHLHVRFDTGDGGQVPPGTEQHLADALDRLVGDADLVLAADYGSGLFSPALIRRLGLLAASAGVPLVVDAHQPDRWAGTGAAALTPNADEVRVLLPEWARAGYLSDRAGAVTACRAEILAAAGAPLVAVTLDRDGVLLLARDAAPVHVPADPAPDAQAVGAGDSFAAAFALALAAGVDPAVAAELGGAAAAVVVRRTGTTVCTAANLRAWLAERHEPTPTPALRRLAKAMTPAQLGRWAAEHRAAGRRVVFTNGCFDVLHRGHVSYLQGAQALGDVLVVAVNSDASVARLKGPGRPINPADDRVAVLAGLRCVDALAVFDDETPADLLREVCPDVYAKGGDYTEAMLPEAPLVRALGGQVHLVDYVEDRSTTGLVERIRATGAG